MSKEKEIVFIKVPDKFEDCIGGTWDIMQPNNQVEKDIGLVRVLITTIRRCPVKSGEDAERSLDLIRIFKKESDEKTGWIEVERDDFSWMLRIFKETAHQVWAAPDSAYLCEWLEKNKRETKEQQ